MPLVFVHGVATRDSPDYRRAVILRDALFKEVSLAGIVAPEKATIANPYWGGSGVSFAWDHASLPGDSYETFGSTQELALDLLINTADTLPSDPETTLTTIARTSLRDAIDLLFAMTAFDDTQTDGAALIRLATRALAYADRHAQLSWLDQVSTDTVFVDYLQLAMDAEEPSQRATTETYGFAELVGTLKTAATRTAQVANDLIARAARAKTEAAVTTLRPALNDRITTFVGDALIYVKNRGTPAGPDAIVARDIETAVKDTSDRTCDPIIIVAHSMGGNIVYDLLTHIRPDLGCDVLVTVGSQVALFEEMKLFGASNPEITGPNPAVPKPDNVKHWINIYDINDVLSYVAATVFTGVQDYRFDTGKTVLGAHSAYFLRQSFHARLNARLKDVL